MAASKIRALDKQEEDLVHEYSLKSLNEIGVLVRSQSVLKMLDDSGANVDHKNMIAKIPEEMVKEAIKRAPKRIKICARNPKNDFEIPVDDIPYSSTDGLTIYMRDLETGEKRNATRKDLGNFAKLADALKGIDFFWPIVTVRDVPEFSHTVHEMWVSQLNGGMHTQGDSVTRDDALMQIELAALIVGGKEELKKRPIFSIVDCPVAPLSFEKGAVEAQVEMAKAGIPIVAMSMSLSGMSSPITFAGTIVNINTENLASMAITQFAESGAPFIYSSESAPIDMLTGNLNYSAPEMIPISAAAGQMAKRYNIPCMVGGWGNGSGTEPGMDASFNELASGLLTSMCNTDLVCGIGGLDSAKGCSLEQMVIDSYFWEEFSQFMRSFRVSEETIALDIVREVGHGNSFLTHPHTARNFRKELHFWDKKKLAWQATFSKEMVPEAREIAKRLLREHEVDPVDPEIVKQGEIKIKEYEKRHIA